MWKLKERIVLVGTLLVLGSGVALGANPETQKQLDDLKAAIPKFAVPVIAYKAFHGIGQNPQRHPVLSQRGIHGNRLIRDLNAERI